jgi:predicted short-subunit dehydrogenase-like oxidoreductase (DUF2520 family)
VTATARLKIGLIGDEIAGIVLAKAWAGVGHDVVGAYLTTEASAERADALLPGIKLLDMARVAETAELLLLALEDSSIEPAVTSLAELGLLGPRKVLIHLSPRFGYGVMANAARVGALPIALTPLLTFTGTSLDLIALRSAMVAITAPDLLLPIAQALAIELGAEPVVIQEQQREAFAEALAVAADFSTLVIQQAVGILRTAEVDQPETLIAPVVRAAVEQALTRGLPPINPGGAL